MFWSGVGWCLWSVVWSSSSLASGREARCPDGNGWQSAGKAIQSWKTVEIMSSVIDCLSGDFAGLVGRLGVVVEEGRSGNKGVFPFPCLHSLPRTAA